MLEEQEHELIAFICCSVLEDGGKPIAADTQLFKEKRLNSMNILDLIGYVEQHLGRRLEDREIVMANFESVRSITRAFFTDAE
ncbi:MAG: phosphopantetheine-binding protein [Chloroflexota bacterium]|nr:phosphopantetheine-binding protein [Chloroflexota bacterium]